MTKANTIAEAAWTTGQERAPDFGITPVRVPWDEAGVDTRRWMRAVFQQLLDEGIIR